MMNRERYSKEQKIIGHRDKLLFFVIIAEKGFSWQNDLIKSYAITIKNIQIARDILAELGYVTFRQFNEIEEAHQEAILKIIPHPERFYDQNNLCFCITPEGRVFYESIRGIIEKKRENPTFEDLLRKTLDKTSAYRKVFDKIEEEENLLLERRVTYPKGLSIKKRTSKAREIESHIQEMSYLRDITKGQLSIGQLSKMGTSLVSSKQELSTYIKQKKEAKLKQLRSRRATVTYKGKYFEAKNTQEIEEMSKGISKKELQQQSKYRLDGSEKLKGEVHVPTYNIPKDSQELDSKSRSMKAIQGKFMYEGEEELEIVKEETNIFSKLGIK